MTRSIPPFAALRAFEATCRLGGQKAAAAELHVSTSAVSHQIRELETFVGIGLFSRGPRGPVLTERGRAYHERVCLAMDVLSQATDEIMAVVDAMPIRIHMFQSLANLWFVPHLAEFTRRNPDQRVIVQSIPETVMLAGSEIDAMIVYAREPPMAALVHHLFREVVVPVCSPAFLNQHGPLNTVDLILRQRLISSTIAADEWVVWATTAGCDNPDPQAHILFDNRANILEAAQEGMGIALDRRPFGEIQRTRGLLVAPFAQPQATGWSYFLVTNEGSYRSQKVRPMIQWLASLSDNFDRDQ